MTKLKDIPPDMLKEIERFVKQKKGKVPVSGGGPTPDGGYVKNLVELVKEKFGVELSPAQIYRLQHRKRRKKVELDKDTVEWLEENFGSVNEGIRQVTKMLSFMVGKPPEKYRNAISQLGGRTLDYDEVVFELKQLGYENPDEVIRELFKMGYGRNVNGKLRFFRYKQPPELELLRFFAGLVG